MIQNGQIVDVYLERADENSPAKLRTERRRGAKDRRKLPQRDSGSKEKSDPAKACGG